MPKKKQKKRDPVAYSMRLRKQKAGIHPDQKKQKDKRLCRESIDEVI